MPPQHQYIASQQAPSEARGPKNILRSWLRRSRVKGYRGQSSVSPDIQDASQQNVPFSTPQTSAEVSTILESCGQTVASDTEPRSNHQTSLKPALRAIPAYFSNKDGYVCLWPGCYRGFTTVLDLLQHHRDVHAYEFEFGSLVDCPVPSCYQRGALGFRNPYEMAHHMLTMHPTIITPAMMGFTRDRVIELVNTKWPKCRPWEIDSIMWNSYMRSSPLATSHGGDGASMSTAANNEDCGPQVEDLSRLNLEAGSIRSHVVHSQKAGSVTTMQPRMSAPEDKGDCDLRTGAWQGLGPTHEMAERTTGPELAAETIQSESSIGNRLDDAVGQRDPEKQNKPAHPDEPGTEVGNDPLLTSEYLGDPMCYHPNTSDPAEASFNAQPITPSCSRNEPTAVGLIGRTGADDMRDSAFNSREHFSLQELKTCATPRRAPAMVDSESVGVSVGDVGDFGDDIRDLKNRLDGLMILTESKSHSTSDDSAGEENTSLSSFGSPVSSPRIREHACGHRNSGGSPIQSTAAPPESGGLSGQYNGRSDGDDDEGEHRHGVQDNGTSSSSSQSSKSKRYPCVYRVGDPERFGSHTTCWSYVSQVLRHLESHNFFMCSKCLTKFNTKEQKSMHDKMRACVKICTNGACKRHTMDFETPSTSCNCLMTSDDLWAATFRQAFPHLPLPAPWSSKVQSWLVPPVQSMQQEPWIQTYCQSQPWSYPENLPADMTAQDGFDLQAMMDYNVDSELPAPGFHNAIPTANTPLNLDGGNDLHAAFPNTNPTRHPANTSANHTAQSVSHTDIQKLREQVAILEQRVERPSRSEQKESAMLRLAWNRLIEIGDQSVQEGGVLRQVASMLTPQLIEDGKKDSNAAQPMEMSNVMDWDAAGLGPQNLGPGGKGKQRAVSGAEDSAYCSGMQMG